MNNVEKTVDLFSAGLNCSQAILTVFGESYGLDAEMAANLGRPLGGGIGHLAKTCGAVTAAALILGMAKDDQDEEKQGKPLMLRSRPLQAFRSPPRNNGMQTITWRRHEHGGGVEKGPG